MDPEVVSTLSDTRRFIELLTHYVRENSKAFMGAMSKIESAASAHKKAAEEFEMYYYSLRNKP